MDTDTFLTPRKLLQNALARTSSRTSMSSSPSLLAVKTPTSLARASNISCNTTTGRLNLLPVLQTPPSRMLKARVVNPFEPALADRLHLPMIGSPSLFHRPSTPHNSSTSQFEWTIDEVSSLGPANVEVHETQYIETVDPVMEARVQAAISTYFKEHSIVPSPIDCPLRNQKIVLSKDSVDLSTGISEKGRSKRRTRDGVSQTILTFPPQLPDHVEEVLQKYLTYKEDQQQTHNSTLDESAGCSIDHDARDASLRRKLFNISGRNADSDDDAEATRLGNSLDDLELQALSPAPDSPEVVISQESANQQDLKRTRYFGSQDALYPDDLSLSPVIDSDAESSFGALSPISKNSLSPCPGDEHDQHHSDLDAIYRSTPEPSTQSVQSDHHSLELGGSRVYADGSVKHTELTNVLAETCLSNDGDNNLSSSSQSVDSSQRSRSSITPLRRYERKVKRPNNRKNLSHSFLLINENSPAGDVNEKATHKDNTADVSMNRPTPSKVLSPIKENFVAGSGKLPKDVNFYRTDSGFNEESQSHDNANDLSDVSMLSEEFCNTPGRKRYESVPESSNTLRGHEVSYSIRL
ncbi:protein aurora borealis [Anopheles ziemanni]|uniref:protein aurora borealis n=1 Tax=Anopheles coustani TaxID=139045 RepID=UPI0026598826|nr:protein aurora borealis [Anopheles coustani]XP_058171900.1 protein aurora borealis [Anopheles ziemanni]